MKKIVFWQNTLSIHQAPLLSALASLGVEVTLVAEEGLLAERRQSGWQVPDFVGCRVVVCPSRGERLQIVEKTASDSFHIVTGIHAYPETFWTLKKLLPKNANVGLYLEQIDDAGFRGFIKRCLYDWHAIRISKKIKFLLATGANGRKWFSARGFSGETIYPFAYFVKLPILASAADASASTGTKRFNLCFVGSLIPLKSIDLLIRALAELRSLDWSLEIIGDGPERENLLSEAAKYEIEDRIFFKGKISNESVFEILANYDLLVLSSRYDGWGAVVSEALQCGTPVLVSDACGSCDLVQHSEVGRIFRAGSVEDLRGKLESFMQEGKVALERRVRIREWARKTISPEAGASYLLEILEYTSGQREERPVAPWHKERVL